MMKEKGLEHGEISGFLDEGTDFEGELRFRDTMRIDGKFRGKISSKNVLIIGEMADIEGEIKVSHVSISGRVTGKIIADAKVEVHAKGRVFCDITTPKLVIEDGAFFHGNCDMNGATKEAEKKAGAAAPVAASLAGQLKKPEKPEGEPVEEKKG